MTAQQRPATVKLIAVLNFLVGGIGLAMLLVGVILSLITWAWGPKGNGEITARLQAVPGFLPFVLTASTLSAIMDVVLIVAGVGLLRMKKWGRTLCLIYAAYLILSSVVGASYQFIFVAPEIEKWVLQDMQAAGGAGGGEPPVGIVRASLMIGSALTALVSVAYAVILLGVMNLPDVRRVFTGIAPATVSGTVPAPAAPPQ